MDIWQLLFSTHGRLNRLGFWQGIGICVVVLFLLVLLLPMDILLADPKTALYASMPLVFISYSLICIIIKRLHDRGRSGSAATLLIFPILCYLVSPYSEGVIGWFLGHFFPLFFITLFVLDWGVFIGNSDSNRFGKCGMSLTWKKKTSL